MVFIRVILLDLCRQYTKGSESIKISPGWLESVLLELESNVFDLLAAYLFALESIVTLAESKQAFPDLVFGHPWHQGVRQLLAIGPVVENDVVADLHAGAVLVVLLKLKLDFENKMTTETWLLHLLWWHSIINWP